jgi:hypothetical protein
MHTDITQWTYEQFLAYLYIHAASANGDLNANETGLIEGRVGEKVYGDILAVYQGHGTEEREQMLKALAGRFVVNSRHREDLLFDFKAIISADGEIDDAESALFKRLKQLI